MTNKIAEFVVAPQQITTLKQSGLDENQRRKFAQRVMSLVLNTPSLQNLNPISIFNVALKMEMLGVSPELETGYIIPYGQSAQFQMGYKGYVELAMRTNLYNKIDCAEVKETDYIGYDLDTDTYEWTDKKLTLQEVVARKKEPTFGYRAFAIMKDGTKQELFMTMDEINNHHNEYSQAYKYRTKNGNVFNGKSKEAMDRKMVLKMFINRRLVKSMNLDDSKDIRTAIEIDSAVLLGESGNHKLFVDNPKQYIEGENNGK